MADARLRLIIDALNKSGDDLSKLKSDLKGVEEEGKGATESTEKLSGGIGNLMGKAAIASAAIAGVVVAMKQVYDTAREGADLLYAETRFDNLAKSIGSTADVLMRDMREATRGLMSDAELVASAADFMGLGLAKSHDEVVRLSNVAGQLGMDMNQLVLTLSNQTTMRFDSLGVSVDGFTEKVDDLTASGMSAQDAFTEAFLQQAEEQIEKVGSIADTTAGSFQRLEVAFTNMADNTKKSVAETLAPAIDWMADGLEQSAKSQDILTRAVDLGIISQKEYNGYMQAGALSTEAQAKIMEDLKAAIDEVTGTTTTPEYREFMNFMTDPHYEAADAVQELADKATLAEDAMRNFTQMLLFEMAAANLESEEAVLALAEAMGLIDNRTVYAAESVDFWAQMLDEKKISVETYNEIVAGLGDNLDRITDRSANIEVTWMEFGGLSPAAQGVFSGGGTGGKSVDNLYGTAAGGPVSAGSPYLWQEYGYKGETLVPSQNGFVLSRADAKRILAEAANGGGGDTYNYNLTVQTSASAADIGTAFELLEAYGGN